MAANEIGQHFITTYEANVIHLVQQKTSKLRRTTTLASTTGEKDEFRVTSARGSMTARTNVGTNAGKRTTTPFVDQVYNNRICTTTPYGSADSYSKADLTRVLGDPQSTLTQSMAMQAGRSFDDVIIAALFATAYDSLGNAYAHPAGQQLGGATQAFNFDFVRAVREAISEKDVDPDEEVFLLVSPNAVSSLLDEAVVTSNDYTNGKALMGGMIIQGWMGFTWIMTNRLTKAVAGPPAQVYAAAYTRDAIGLKINSDFTVDIGRDPGTWFDWVVMGSIDIGSVRIQDDKVWRLHFLETN